MEHEELADELEHEAAQLEQRSQEVGDHIDETRADWEQKQAAESVPGAEHGDHDQPSGRSRDEGEADRSPRADEDPPPEEEAMAKQ